MIHEIIPIITDELNTFLESHFSLSENAVVLSNILNQDGSVAIKDENKVIATLINVERDGSNQYQGAGFARTDLPIHVNLYLLFSCYFVNYSESLKFLSGIIAFFQTTPNYVYDGNTIKIEFYNIDIKELNTLWTGIGAKYMPSVIYKFRTIGIDEERLRDEIPPVSTVITY